MFAERRGRLRETAETFRMKGAVTPEKAMTAQELGLPPRFEEAMKRRLGRTGIFVDVGGKYYLDEARLKAFEEERGRGGGMWAHGRRMIELRMARMIAGVVVIALILYAILYGVSQDLRVGIVVLLVVWIVMTLTQLYFMSRARARMEAPPPGPAEP